MATAGLFAAGLATAGLAAADLAAAGLAAWLLWSPLVCLGLPWSALFCFGLPRQITKTNQSWNTEVLVNVLDFQNLAYAQRIHKLYYF